MLRNIPQTISKYAPLPEHVPVYSDERPWLAQRMQAANHKVAQASARYGFAVGRLNRAREWRCDHTAGNHQWPRERLEVTKAIRRLRLECDRLKKLMIAAQVAQANLLSKVLA